MQRYRKVSNDDPTRSGMREMSLMHVFRASAGRRDGRDPDQHYQDGERDLTLRSQKRRDGTDEAARRIERVLWNDPATGVMRHADAGYDLALQCAEDHGLNLPSITG